jgi:hypothetical protein
MKFLNFKKLAFILVMFVLITNCKKDEEKKGVSEFAGNYTISSAVMTEALTVSTVESGDVPIPVGTDITELIRTALLSAVSCSAPDTSFVELREDYSLYLSCEGSNPLNAGTWEEVSSTSLKLNLNHDAIPSSPVGFTLKVTDIVKNASGITGVTSVPLPKSMVAEIVSPLTISASAPAIFSVKFSLEFFKIL